jgi:hypothetical protein
MSGPVKVFQNTAFSVATALSRIVLAVTIVVIALAGVALLIIPALATFVAMEWARARRWFAPR